MTEKAELGWFVYEDHGHYRTASQEEIEATTEENPLDGSALYVDMLKRAYDYREERDEAREKLRVTQDNWDESIKSWRGRVDELVAFVQAVHEHPEAPSALHDYAAQLLDQPSLAHGCHEWEENHARTSET